MKFAPPDEHIKLYDTVFGDDLLGRNKVSSQLSSVVDNFEDPLVISLDGQWGTGKSFFLKRWVGAHRKQNGGKALTIYFDAFANDYISDPLPALVTALSARAPEKSADKLENMKKAAFRFIKPAARIGLAMATFGATEALNGLGDAAVAAVGDETKGAIDNFWKKEESRHEAMDNFKSALTDLTNGEEGEIIPVVVVVDELDRCRPDYALEVLETIKHFFSVPHIHFVLGVNMSALENSVKVRYGLEVDASAYLQKFISFSIGLPDHIGDHNKTSATIKYIRHLSEVMGAPRQISEEVENQVRSISRRSHVSMRDAGKIISLSNLIPENIKKREMFLGWSVIAATLLVTKVVRPNLMKKLINASVSKDELMDYFGVDDMHIVRNFSEGQFNDEYDHKLLITLSCWSYVISNGKEKDANGFDISKTFSQFGDVHRPMSIPATINDNWLSEISIS